VFARTGNYLVIDDLLRSSTPYEAHLQWIVAPDVEIEPVAQGFLLHDDKRTVSIVVSTSGLRGYTIDELTDAAGERIAWRIRVPMIGTSNRAVTIISDVVDRQRFKARRVARPGKEFTVDITDKHIDETLVVTPELSAIVPAGLDPEDAVSRTIELAAAGSLSEDEALEQRLQVRRAIQHVKSRIRAEGAGPEARLRGIEQLQDAGRELKVAGLRDHGFASALIDIAGTDLADRIAANPSVGNVRRSPLVRWGDETLIQEGYSVPVHTTLDAGTFPAEAHEPSVWSVDLGQLVISSYLVDEPGDVLTVYFHGATDRTRFSMPRYERLRSMPLLGTGPVMFFSDPCLDLDSRMILSWYVGTEDLDLHREIARMIEAYARKKEIDKVLLVGNSGGGFAALQLGAILQGTRVVSFNPQVQIDRYVPRIAQTAHWSLFGRDTVSDDPVHAPRMDLIESYRRIGFDQDVVLIQNPGDDLHYKEHFLPFTEAFRASGNADRLRALTPYLGPGHRVPPPNEYLDYVRHAVDGAFGNWSLEGIRTTGDSPEARDLDDNRLRTDEIVTRA
jgi:pimeloyl-ACP methyl ester carboxylesterase